MRDFIVLLIGKSGSGKTTICNDLEEFFGWKVLYSYTTRAKRSENETGHTFVSDEEFDKLENICAYTEFDGARYCATQEQVDNSQIYVIDVAGLNYFRKHYKGNKIVIPLYLSVDTKTLYRRMRKRGDSWIDAKRRIWHDRIAFRKAPKKIAIHINGARDLSTVVSDVYEAAKLLAAMTNTAETQMKEDLEGQVVEDNKSGI